MNTQRSKTYRMQESSSKREVYSNTILPQETRNISNSLSLHLKQLEREEQTKPKVSRRKEIVKIRAEIETKKIANINETKSWLFEKINKIDKPLARLIKKKRESIQISKIRNEKGEVTMDTTEMQRIIRDYYKQLYTNKMDNLEEMDKFLERCNLPRLSQEEIENMNSSVTSTKIETVIKNLPTGTSLVVQWLRICLPMQGTWVRSLVQEDPTCRRAAKPMCHNY